MPLTKAQSECLARLIELQAQGFPHRTKLGGIKTGCNTTTLHTLRQMGYIDSSAVYLGGICSPDLKIIKLPGAEGVKSNPAPLRTSRADLTRAVRRYQRFTGHADMTARPMVLPRMPRALLTVGECDGILYTTIREGRKESYIHRFAKGSRPLLTASPDGKRLYLLGGAYTFTERGIVDKRRR